MRIFKFGRYLTILLSIVFITVNCKVEKDDSSVSSGSYTNMEVGTAESTTISASSASNYQFTTDQSGKHTLYIYNISPADTVFSVSYSYDNWIGFCYGSDNCTFNEPSSGSTVRFSLTEESGNDVTCSIIVVEGDGGEGTAASPVDLSIGQSHTGTIGSGINYYRFTAASNGFHSITTSSSTQILYWDLYESSNFTSLNSYKYNFSDTGDVSGDTGNLASGTTYYLKVSNYGDTYGSFDIIVAGP